MRDPAVGRQSTPDAEYWSQEHANVQEHHSMIAPICARSVLFCREVSMWNWSSCFGISMFTLELVGFSKIGYYICR